MWRQDESAPSPVDSLTSGCSQLMLAVAPPGPKRRYIVEGPRLNMEGNRCRRQIC